MTAGRGGPAPLPDSLLAGIEEVAVSLAGAGGRLLSERFGGVQVSRFKSSRDRDPVTEADEAAEALVRDGVRERFPLHGFLGEEGGARSTNAEFVWVVDPLDGTANFANGIPIFACSIGVLHRGRPVVAALYTAFGDDGRACIFHARAGGGLFRDGRSFVPDAPTHRGRLVGIPAGYHRRFRKRLLRRMPPGETRSFGSTAAELGLVACGRLRYGIWDSPKIWDVAAGVLLVTEGGGEVFTVRAGRSEPLTAFAPRGSAGLAGWRGSVIAGDAPAIREFRGALRVRPSLNERIERAFGQEAAVLSEKASGVVRRLAGAGLRLWRLFRR